MEWHFLACSLSLCWAYVPCNRKLYCNKILEISDVIEEEEKQVFECILLNSKHLV